MASTQTRNIILTASFAAITATGAWYGAGLKTRQEFKQERQTIIESTTQDKISQLELTREKYVRQKAELQAKIDRLARGEKADGDEGKVMGR